MFQEVIEAIQRSYKLQDKCRFKKNNFSDKRTVLMLPQDTNDGNTVGNVGVVEDRQK